MSLIFIEVISLKIHILSGLHILLPQIVKVVLQTVFGFLLNTFIAIEKYCMIEIITMLRISKTWSQITLTFLPQHSLLQLLDNKILFIQEVIFSKPIKFNISTKLALTQNVKKYKKSYIIMLNLLSSKKINRITKSSYFPFPKIFSFLTFELHGSDIHVFIKQTIVAFIPNLVLFFSFFLQLKNNIIINTCFREDKKVSAAGCKIQANKKIFDFWKILLKSLFSDLKRTGWFWPLD